MSTLLLLAVTALTFACSTPEQDCEAICDKLVTCAPEDFKLSECIMSCQSAAKVSSGCESKFTNLADCVGWTTCNSLFIECSSEFDQTKTCE